MSNTQTANRKKKKKLVSNIMGGGGWRLYSYESLEEGVPPGSPYPDRISDQNMSFSTPVLRPEL